MIAVKAYQLAFDGAGMHEMYGLSKVSITATQNKQLAEYFLNKLDYAGRASSAASFLMRGQEITATRNHTVDYIKHIHRACKNEIESKWNKPMLSDEEASDILFEDMLADELEKITEKVDIRINL